MYTQTRQNSGYGETEKHMWRAWKQDITAYW